MEKEGDSVTQRKKEKRVFYVLYEVSIDEVKEKVVLRPAKGY